MNQPITVTIEPVSEQAHRVERLVAYGLPVSKALGRALGGIVAFSRRHGFASSRVSACFGRYLWRTESAIREAAARELGATREWIDTLIDSQPVRYPQPPQDITDSFEPAQERTA